MNVALSSLYANISIQSETMRTKGGETYHGNITGITIRCMSGDLHCSLVLGWDNSRTHASLTFECSAPNYKLSPSCGGFVH